MRGLYTVLKRYEKDFLDLRERFYLGENIGFGSFPVHHHWVDDSMPFAALPVRKNDGKLEVKATLSYFPEWHNYDVLENDEISILKGTTVVKPELSKKEKGYLVSAYMYKAFANAVFFKMDYDESEQKEQEIRAEYLADGEIYPYHPAFTEMPRDVFRGGLSLILGFVASTKNPKELKKAFNKIPYAEWDEALTLSVYIGETQNVRQFLDYWERIFEQFFSEIDKPELNSELEEMIDALNNIPEIFSRGIRLERFGRQEGEAQLRILRCIKLRKRFLDEVIS